MTSFNFHFRPSARPGKNKGSIFLRVIHERKSFSLSLGLHVYADEWDQVSRTATLPAPASKRYSALKAVRNTLESTSVRLERIIFDLDAQGYFSVRDIREQICRCNGAGMLSSFVEQLTGQIGVKQRRTARAYKSVVNSVLKFNGGKDVRLVNINRKFVESYETWMKDNGLHMNTVSFYMRNLRAIYNRAVRANFIVPGPVNPFTNVFTGIKPTEKKALDPSQMRALIDIDSSLVNFCFKKTSALPRHLRDALAMFLFSFYAQGMSFVDMAYLRKDMIRGGMIKYRRKKTGQDIEVAVSREMNSIMAYFASRTQLSDYVFPIISSGRNDRMQYESALRLQNYRLKKLAALTGRVDRITTHAARHSWATIAKNEKVDISIISEALGHKSETTTRIYLDSFKRKWLDKANEKIRRAIKKAV